jgi:hypothetical protein
VLHFNNGQLFDIAAQFVIVPVVAHLGVEEVLGNGRQLVLQCFIQYSDDFWDSSEEFVGKLRLGELSK